MELKVLNSLYLSFNSSKIVNLEDSQDALCTDNLASGTNTGFNIL